MPSSGSFAGVLMKCVYHWLSIEAQYASSAAEAKEALARFPGAADAGVHVHGFEAWAAGKVHLLAGDHAEAVKALKSALATCTAMPTTDLAFARVPFSWMEAQLLLGEALEESDRSSACEAYARVIERWKDAKPRSVSVEKARALAGPWVRPV